MDSSIVTIGDKGTGGSTPAEGTTICAEGADEGVSVGDSSIVTIGAKGAGGSTAPNIKRCLEIKSAAAAISALPST